MIIDIDSIIILTFAKDKRLARFKSLKEIFIDFNGLISAFRRTGALKVLAITHLMTSIFIVVISFFVFNDYIVPILIGVISHLSTDLLLFIGK